MQSAIDSFLLIGQSNMAGRGDIGKVPAITHTDILMFREGQWQMAEEPLHQDKPHAGIGLGMSFAATLLEALPGQRIGVIPCAVGGTPLSRWMPGADLYENAVAITKRAMANSTLKGVLWHQGESDAQSYATASSYEQRFTMMITTLRETLDGDAISVIVGQLGEYLHDQPGGPYYDLVNQALRRAAEILPLCANVSAQGLTHKGDGLHFSAASLRTLGRRYAQAYLRLLGRSSA
jgi:hypothetical protein